MTSAISKSEPRDLHGRWTVATGAVQGALSDELRTKRYRGAPNPLTGHGYVASESLYHLLGGKAAGYKPYFIHHEGEPHWFLKHEPTGQVIDATAGQFRTPVPYDKAKGKGFLTRLPSKRARTVMDRIAQTPIAASIHNVSDEPRDARGRWTRGATEDFQGEMEKVGDTNPDPEDEDRSQLLFGDLDTLMHEVEHNPRNFVQVSTPHTMSGWKAHVWCANTDDIRQVMYHLLPVVREYGLGCKVATERFFEAAKGNKTQRNKGVTVYFPEHDTAPRDATAIADELQGMFAGRRSATVTEEIIEGKDPADFSIPGDTMVATGLGIRWELSKGAPDRDLNYEDYHRYYESAVTAAVAHDVTDEARDTRGRWTRGAPADPAGDIRSAGSKFLFSSLPINIQWDLKDTGTTFIHAMYSTKTKEQEDAVRTAREAVKTLGVLKMADRLYDRLETDESLRTWLHGFSAEYSAMVDNALNTWPSLRPDRGEGWSQPDSPYSEKSALRYLVNNIQLGWAESSASDASLALHYAVTKNLGVDVDDATMRRLSRDDLTGLQRNAEKLYEKVAPFLDAYVQETYAETQRQLHAAGLSEVHLVRGMSWRSIFEAPRELLGLSDVELEQGLGNRYVKHGDVDDVELTSNPLTSWSTEANVAEDFALLETDRAVRTTVGMTVPARDIFALSSDGLGCLTEAEMIVLGGTGHHGSVRWQWDAGKERDDDEA